MAQEGVMAKEEAHVVENPAEFLRNQDGTFDVVSPYGYIFRVTCRRGTRMYVREIGQSEPIASFDHTRWQVEKIA